MVDAFGPIRRAAKTAAEAVRVFVAWVGRDDVVGDPGLPTGWIQVGVDETDNRSIVHWPGRA